MKRAPGVDAAGDGGGGAVNVGDRIGARRSYMRDDRPFGGDAYPAALFHYSPDRTAGAALSDKPGSRRSSLIWRLDAHDTS